MKKIILIASLFCNFAYAAGEYQCASLAKYAKVVASAQEVGMSEEAVHKINSEYKKKQGHQEREAIIRYVFIMKPTEEHAQREVYLKCLAGQYSNK